MENKIIVIYIGVAGVRSEDINDYVHAITKRIAPSSIKAEIITIPVNTYDTRVECINPQYVTDEILIKKHSELMKELHEELQHQINQLKENDEKN